MSTEKEAGSPVYYGIDDEQFAKLQRLAGELQGGSDRERDYGHRLWLLVNQIRQQEIDAP